jgi:hypothetical protein
MTCAASMPRPCSMLASRCTPWRIASATIRRCSYGTTPSGSGPGWLTIIWRPQSERSQRDFSGPNERLVQVWSKFALFTARS